MFELEIAKELRALYEQPATDLVTEVNLRLVPRGLGPISAARIVESLVSQEPNAPQVIAFHQSLAFWDVNEDARFSESPGTLERRREVLTALGLVEFENNINQSYPVPGGSHYVIGSKEEWQAWYKPELGNGFYWHSYKRVLRQKRIETAEIEKLSASVDDVMRRLSSPSAANPYQSKGLVIGHVQSGKTSHFAGLIAKSISSGYRLIIVLTGTIELLRAQTQRRLDMELVGKENILNGRKESEVELLMDVDYVGDEDWDRFVSFDRSIVSDPSVPNIIRLTTYKNDFKSLQQGLDALDFQQDKKRMDLPVYARENLAGMPVRLLVLKKNSATLKKVIRDLKSIHTNLQEVPALIIDDEADQASPNTKKPPLRKPEEDEGKKERTAINQHISTLLKLMPRAQYVGYTATPFANVFIEPDDYEDIFPKDFIISLEPSRSYLGSKHFHDVEVDHQRDRESMVESNEAAFVRGVYAFDDDSEIQELSKALDSFVLSGAIKLYRQSQGVEGDFRHHTMLAHTSAFKQQHRDLKELVEQAWQSCSFYSPIAVSRLWELLQSDFLALSIARNLQALFPSSKEELSNFIGEALALIDREASPVVLVNSDQDIEASALNFKDRREWRCVIGGAKLSRGFTVEGLTVSYFRRRTSTQDALLQMGRWFGYRPGYGDLVRLFIGRSEKHNDKAIDLYEAFTATVRDEEEFRASLKIYAEISEQTGTPMVTPAEVPPLVYQQLGWLKPTSRNKMYNAVLTTQGYSEKFIELARHLPYEPKRTRQNFDLFRQHIAVDLTEEGQFRNSDNNPIQCLFGIIDANKILAFLDKFNYSGETLKPTANFIRDSISNGTIEDFFVMIHLPSRDNVEYRQLDNPQLQLPIVVRKRRPGTGGFVGTERRNRAPIEAVSGRNEEPSDPLVKKFRSPKRGSMLIELVGEGAFGDASSKLLNPEQVAVFFGFVFPHGSAPNRGKVAFQAAK